ncbi:MAG: alanine racemase [Microbacterium sp.]|nr:alanine racemase [Microbacterium sp.]
MLDGCLPGTLDHGADVDPTRATGEIAKARGDAEALLRHGCSEVGGGVPDSLGGVTAADLGDDSARVRVGSGPVARVSRSALRANARLIDGPFLGDFAADAWGHGVAEVRRALDDVITDRRPSSPVPARDDGLPAEHVNTLLGLPGGDSRSRPAMSLVGRVLSTKVLLADEGVSYGLTYRAPEDTHIALVTGGYAQGVLRGLGNRVSVSIAQRRCPVIGRVAMDVCVVDIRDAHPERGAEVVFFGDGEDEEPHVREWCAASGLSGLEIVTAVGLHARREYVP